MIRKLREGDLRRDKVKDVACSLADVLEKTLCPQTITQADPKQHGLRPKGRLGEEAYQCGNGDSNGVSPWRLDTGDSGWTNGEQHEEHIPDPEIADARNGHGRHGDMEEPVYGNTLVRKSSTEPRLNIFTPDNGDELLGEGIYETLGTAHSLPNVGPATRPGDGQIQPNHGARPDPAQTDRSSAWADQVREQLLAWQQYKTYQGIISLY